MEDGILAPYRRSQNSGKERKEQESSSRSMMKTVISMIKKEAIMVLHHTIKIMISQVPKYNNMDLW